MRYSILSGVFSLLVNISCGFTSNYETTTYERFNNLNLKYYRVYTNSVLDLNGPHNVFVCMTVCTKYSDNKYHLKK